MTDQEIQAEALAHVERLRARSQRLVGLIPHEDSEAARFLKQDLGETALRLEENADRILEILPRDPSAALWLARETGPKP